MDWQKSARSLNVSIAAMAGTGIATDAETVSAFIIDIEPNLSVASRLPVNSMLSSVEVRSAETLGGGDHLLDVSGVPATLGGNKVKHIVCVIDGTWQTATMRKTDDNFSNAYNLNWMLENRTDDGSDQVVFYFSGLGTDQSSQPYTAGAFARGLDHQIAEAYINIASNYRLSPAGETPDKIYLFGFSRGSVAARAIAGMISHCGLLQPSRMNHYQEIYEAFISGEPLSGALKKFVYRDVAIEFVGVFDTVFGGYSMSRKFNELEFPNLDLPKAVKVGVHFLAIDERRKFFAPMLWESCAKDQVLEQIWMPGVHSDIGGVYPNRYLGMRALRSMIDRILKHTDLRFNKVLLASLDTMIEAPTFLPHINNELVMPWGFLPKITRHASQTAKHQYLHPVIRDIDRLPVAIRRRIQDYDIRSFLAGAEIPYFDDWYDMPNWPRAD